jgi:hypothetical protein
VRTENETKLRLIGISNVYEKGGSKATVIPSKVVKYLDLSTGDKLLFIVKENGTLMVGTEDHFGGLRLGNEPIALEFPIPVEELENLIRQSD